MKTEDDPDELHFENVTLDLKRRLLFRNGKNQKLSDQRWRALMLLVNSRPNTVSLAELQKVFDQLRSEGTLAKHIEFLRKALGDTDKKHRFIKTEYNEGYRFIAKEGHARVPAKIAAHSEHMPQTSKPVEEDFHRTRRIEDVATSGLIALYNFAGQTKDQIGNGHDGKAIGPIRYVRPGRWYAAGFDGRSSCIRIEDHPSLRLAQFTLAAWINPTSFQSAGNRIVEKGDSNCYWLDINPHGNALVGVRSDRYYAYNVLSRTPLELNAWHFIAGTCDETTLSLYINGNVVRSMLYEFKPNHNDEPIVIGWKINGVPEDHFCGFIHELRIYNRALQKSDLDKLFVPVDRTLRDWNPALIDDDASIIEPQES